MTSHPLRIAILGLHYSPEVTGNAPYTSSLASALAALGHEVRVITSHPHYPEWRIREGYGRWVSTETIDGVSVKRLRHFVPRQPGNLSRLVSEISFGLRIILTPWGRPDVVLLVSPALFSTAMAGVRARFGIRRPPVGVWVQDFYSLGMAETGSGGKLAVQLLRRVEAFALRSASGVAAIHERFKSHMISGLGVKRDAIVVIRNWTHLQEATTFDGVTVRERLGWTADETVVLHAGNMGLKQGLDNVVEAARLADKLGLPVKFVLMGNGNQRSRLESAAQGIGRISFIDSLPDAMFQAALGSADVLLVNELPGVTEMSVPSKLTSYFSTGLPVIGATDVGSVTAGELDESGGGIRVDPGRPDNLLDGVLLLAENTELRNSLGVSGLRYRQTTLSEEVAVSKFAAWLESLAETRRSSNQGTRPTDLER